MISSLVRRILGSANDRVITALKPIVAEINEFEPAMQALSDQDLAAQTQLFRDRLQMTETIDDLLPEAFAVVREAARRVLGQRPFDVQLMGSIILHQGKIAEMKTGEGKTLVATLPAYLNALPGRGVHIVTVNDYLARRDSEWMGRIFRFLGMNVGCIVHGLTDAERQEAYRADITYGTNNELGFDYLRDNMKFSIDEIAQREFNMAIVDEVDSILVDEARTPLIISGPAESFSELYQAIDVVVRDLPAEFYEIDRKQRVVTLTDPGAERIERELASRSLLGEGESMYDPAHIALVHHVNQALRAHQLFERDTDYIVKDGRIVIIDEFTGRMMEGRRYSDGLHQALEAREGVEVQMENQTLASITFQNYFRLYPKLAGMTGTAMTEANEFAEIYSLDVVEIPTNLPAARQDLDDVIYRTTEEKWQAIIALIEECRSRKQPVLVGTVSIEKSEMLSSMLRKRGIRHHVLNARYHEQEAYIIAQAGALSGVTIATNMAGRGTDIQLGGNLDMRVERETARIQDPADRLGKAEMIRKEIGESRQVVLESGGLFVIGTERHESRRIDNQLRGRSGRQGDPGSSRFFLSLDDDLMRIFGSGRIDGFMQKLGLKQGEAIVHPWVNTALQKAQQKVEARNFEIRKQLLRFDNVINDQRKVIYEQRRELIAADSVTEEIESYAGSVITRLVERAMPDESYPEQWEVEGLRTDCQRILALDLPITEWAGEEGIAHAEIQQRIQAALDRSLALRRSEMGASLMRRVEKGVVLQILDHVWKDHLLALDFLRQGISLRAYGQRDPLNEFKSEAFTLFYSMLERMRETTLSTLTHLQLATPDESEVDTLDHTDIPLPLPPGLRPAAPPTGRQARAQRGTAGGAGAGTTGAGELAESGQEPDQENFGQENWGRVPRNAPCPCGSGRKFKHCHGRVRGVG